MYLYFELKKKKMYFLQFFQVKTDEFVILDLTTYAVEIDSSTINLKLFDIIYTYM